VQLVETTSGAYYGKGYQDVQNRVPKIDNTMQELGWRRIDDGRRAAQDLRSVSRPGRRSARWSTAALTGRTHGSHRPQDRRRHAARHARRRAESARMLRRFRRATFLFSLGPDHTGWALRRVFRPGFCRRCRARRWSSTTA
jgi:hypothetical protein